MNQFIPRHRTEKLFYIHVFWEPAVLIAPRFILGRLV